MSIVGFDRFKSSAWDSLRPISFEVIHHEMNWCQVIWSILRNFSQICKKKFAFIVPTFDQLNLAKNKYRVIECYLVIDLCVFAYGEKAWPRIMTHEYRYITYDDIKLKHVILCYRHPLVGICK